jgi:hypothetical protein
MGLTAGVTGQQMLIPPRHLILPSHLSEVPVAYTWFCNCVLDNDCVLHVVIFAILYCNRGQREQKCNFTFKKWFSSEKYFSSLFASLRFGWDNLFSLDESHCNMFEVMFYDCQFPLLPVTTHSVNSTQRYKICSNVTRYNKYISLLHYL